MAEIKEITIKIPSRKLIFKRLSKVSSEMPALAIYENIARYAGEEKFASALTLMFQLAIIDETKDYPPMIAFLLSKYIPLWIDALLMGNEPARKSAQAFYKEYIERVKQEGEHTKKEESETES